MSSSPMQSAPIRLIAADLDGTLVHSTGIVTARNREAMRRARESGIHIAINTGRRHSYALRPLRPLQLPPEEVIISSNGAVVRTFSGELLWRGTMPLPLVHRLLRELRPWRNALVFTLDLVGPEGADVAGALLMEELDTLHGSIRRWMDVNAASIQRVRPLEDAFAPGATEPIQAMLCGRMAAMHDAEALLRERFGGDVQTYRTEYPGNDLCILDIMPWGRSKGTAMLQLADRCHVPPEQTMAIGDNWNDLPMLQAAATAVVLRNAPAGLLQYAANQGWTIGAAADEDGVAQAIEGVIAGGAPLA